MTIARLAPTPERHAAAQPGGVVDDEHLGAAGGVLLQLVPRAAQQQRVAGPQRLVGALEGVAGPVHREHDEVAARRRHAGEEVLADERRARRHDAPRSRPRRAPTSSPVGQARTARAARR